MTGQSLTSERCEWYPSCKKYEEVKAALNAGRAEAEQERQNRYKVVRDYEREAEERERAEAEADRLREALEHYANEDHWTRDGMYDGGWADPMQIAREALAGAGGETPK